MNDIGTSLSDLSRLIESRLALMRSLAESLESSSLALVRNDAEAIARGAAHQAELCRQWSHLEDELRREAARRSEASLSNRTLNRTLNQTSNNTSNIASNHSARLQVEWEELGTRIRYLTRVHWSLLRHLQRSLDIMNRVIDSCAPTYTPDPSLFRTTVRLGAESRAGE
jgi:hypothetical protein